MTTRGPDAVSLQRFAIGAARLAVAVCIVGAGAVLRRMQPERARRACEVRRMGQASSAAPMRQPDAGVLHCAVYAVASGVHSDMTTAEALRRLDGVRRAESPRGWMA